MVRLRSGELFPKREEPTTTKTMPPRRKRATSSASAAGASVCKEEKVSSPDPPAAPASRKRPAVSGAAVEDTDALDCGVCFLPLKPPIFQCDVGHVVCSPCRDKLKATGKCHVCGGATGGFRRCHAMEHLVESVRGPCPHTAHGCTSRPPYYDLDVHRQTCPHSRWRCPGEACGFVGSIGALLDHFAGGHGWPRATKDRLVEDELKLHRLCLRDGFNFLLVDHAAGATNREYLFLLNVARQPLGVAVSVVHIHPHGASDGGQGPSSKELKCLLTYSEHGRHSGHSAGNVTGDQFVNHYQNSKFRVVSTDLSNGLPSPDSCFQFVVMNSVLGGHHVRDIIEVRARIIIS